MSGKKKKKCFFSFDRMFYGLRLAGETVLGEVERVYTQTRTGDDDAATTKNIRK